MDVLEATIRICGEVTFTSREVGRLADTQPYILNTALYYALGFVSGQYVDTAYKPNYVDDTAGLTELYVSPAAPVSDSAQNYITSTYNTTKGEYVEMNYSAQDDPNAKQNLPTYGRRRSLGQGTKLRFFIIPRDQSIKEIREQIPRYIRLGKKRGKARLDQQKRTASRQAGEFRLTHPIGAYDHTDLPEGNIITKSMKPTPLIIQGDYRGEYLSIDRGKEDRIRVPAGLTFLATKR